MHEKTMTLYTEYLNICCAIKTEILNCDTYEIQIELAFCSYMANN